MSRLVAWGITTSIGYSHLSNNRGGWNKRGGEAKICQITKRGGWNKCGGWKIFMKSINMEGGFFS